MPDTSDSPSPQPGAAASSVEDPGPAQAAPEDAGRGFHLRFSIGSEPGARPFDAAGRPVAEPPLTVKPSSSSPARSASSPEDDGLPRYTVGEEIMNAVTHGVGCLLAIAGLVLLIVKAALDGGQPAYMASAIVFGVTLILEYLASTLYHAIQPRAAKRVFRVIDHSCIYLLIAGSYTPFALITLADAGGAVLFAAVWVIALAGIGFEVAMRQRQPRWLTIAIYLVMGWLVVFRLPQLVAALDPVALALLAVGGACYTIGTPFYLMKRVRYMHSVFHLWVLAGSIFQFMAVILFVI